MIFLENRYTLFRIMLQMQHRKTGSTHTGSTMGPEERPISDEEEKRIEAVWRRLFEEGEPGLIAQQEEHKKYPAEYRCKLCFVPFNEEGAKTFGKVPSQRNGYFCNACDVYITTTPGRGKVHLSIVFVDARNSVGLAEELDDNVVGK